MARFEEDPFRRFQKGSATRRSAEILSDGAIHSRQELSKLAKLAATSVSRMIRMLEEDGQIIEHIGHDDGRNFSYRWVNAPGAKRGKKTGMTTHLENRASRENVHVVSLNGDSEITIAIGKRRLKLVDRGRGKVSVYDGTKEVLIF